jgi:hypothetical protein
MIESRQRDLLATDGIASALKAWTTAAAASSKSAGSRSTTTARAA